ncbi:MAG: hypothetical protein IKD70_09410 [Eggerthellaceae bacterium]|nr:hypothetical protein [Eggerthellaceae bacterium]
MGTSYKDTFSGDFRRGVYCADCCGGIYPYYDTEAEAIEAWNTRYHFGLTDEDYSILLDEMGIAKPERTCRFLPFKGEESKEPEEQEGVCSNCSHYMHFQDNYCPNCGAKVIEE